MHIELLSPAQTIPMGISIHFVNQYSISFKTVVGLDELKRCSYYTTSERQDVILTPSDRYKYTTNYPVLYL